MSWFADSLTNTHTDINIAVSFPSNAKLYWLMLQMKSYEKEENLKTISRNVYKQKKK